jgi:predicted alpha-1,6-mannanase (GH76 family)
MIVFTQAGVVALLTDAVGAILANAHVHLFKNDYVPTPLSVVGDFTEADYTGYAHQVVASADWNSVTLSDGSAGIVGPGLFFNPTGTAVTNVIYGYYITDSTDATVVWAERFDAPRGLSSPGTGFVMVPQVNGQSQAA